MDDPNGWQRLWVLVKWLISIAVGLYAAQAMIGTIPTGEGAPHPTAGQVLVGLGLAGAIAGGIAFSALHALEWVYRGFRPLATGPTEAAPVPLVEASEGGKESPLALPHQAIQQSPSGSPAPSQELQQREFYPYLEALQTAQQALGAMSSLGWRDKPHHLGICHIALS